MKGAGVLWLGLAAIGVGLAYVLQRRFDDMPKSEPLRLPEEKQAFVTEIAAALDNVRGGLGQQTRTIVVAHAAFETGWGATTGYQKGNNLFNITALRSSGQAFVEGPDLEYAADGSVKQISNPFVVYASLEDSIADYFSFIRKSKFGDAYQQLLAGNLEPFLAALYAGHYFTLPLDQYTSRMQAMVRTVGPLMT